MKLELTEDEINGVLMALGELPAKQSINLILKIQGQAQPQLMVQAQPQLMVQAVKVDDGQKESE